jgi:hypothetical protein
VVQDQHEDQIKEQADDLYNQYKIGDAIQPIEERPQAVDITPVDERVAQEGELGGVAGEVGQPGVPGANVQPEPGGAGRATPGGSENVPPQLGRVPRSLESGLSPEERAAYDSEMTDALHHSVMVYKRQGTPEAAEAGIRDKLQRAEKGNFEARNEAEGRRIFGLPQTYAKTAMSTGLEDKSKATIGLSKLNYDSFRPAAVTAAAAARQEAAAARQGQAILNQQIRRAQVAGALQGH